jgi:radical SAM superfamily enzyme YgiQ (UPF0313 family)
MKLMLIKPGIGDIIEGYRLNDGRMEPLQLGILAGLTPPDIEVVLYDERMEQIPFDKPADLVGVTVDSITARRAYAISDEFRMRGIPVVLGGIHVTLAPEEASLHADAIIRGDAEPVWADLIADARKGTMRRNYSAPFGEPQRGILPRRDLFKGKGYLPVSLIQFSRGCPFNCSFCAAARFFGSTHNCRQVEDVVREIEHDNLRLVLFTDDNLTANRSQAKALCRALKPLMVRWASQVSVDLVHDEELLELMAESGCMGQLIGFDSINPTSLRWMNKSPNLFGYDRYEKAVERLREYGFQVWASFILGNDHDSSESIRNTVRFAIDSKFALAFFHILVPYPGTALYARLQKEGRLLFDGRWWLHPKFRYNTATFVPQQLTPKELGEITVWANKEFYSARSIFLRSFDSKTNLGSIMKFLTYMRFNLLVRQTST